MPLVTSTEMFKKAYEGGYAIGAFNVNNMEIIQGITEAAKEVNAPLILQVSAGARKYAKPVYLTKLVEAAILDTGLPICLHLDHGEDFEICKSCIDGGFTSVMIDGSKYPFKENIRITKEVVDYAHSKGVVVEGELGRLAGVEDNISVSAEDALYTDPDEVEEFERVSSNPYKCVTKLVNLSDVANTEKKLPAEWIINDGTFVSDDFVQYALPLIQGSPEYTLEDSLPRFAQLKKVLAKPE
jgi:ketose-bisphosphate aldolase